MPVQLTVLVPVQIPAVYSDATFNGSIHGYPTMDPTEYTDALEAAVDAAVQDDAMLKVVAEMGYMMYRIREEVAVEAKLSTFAGVKEEESI